MQTKIYFQIKLAADKCHNEYSQRTHTYFRSSLFPTRPKLGNACESEPPNELFLLLFGLREATAGYTSALSPVPFKLH